MKEFLYIFRGPKENEQAFARLSPEAMQKEMQKWNAWMEKLAASGKMIGGQPLLPEGKVIKGTARKITDGPFTEGKDIVGGYIIVKADDLQEATDLSGDCPMLESPGGTVEVREIMPRHQA